MGGCKLFHTSPIQHCGGAQIMEALGGDRLWFDRFLANHAALVYYWVLVGVFLTAMKKGNREDLSEASVPCSCHLLSEKIASNSSAFPFAGKHET